MHSGETKIVDLVRKHLKKNQNGRGSVIAESRNRKREEEETDLLRQLFGKSK
jgi:hypothetical protein